MPDSEEYVLRNERISDTVNRIYLDNGDIITLVGTAHVSQNSVEEVRSVIDQYQPDRVCLELDQGRYDSKTKQNSYSGMDLQKVFKEGKAFLVLANTVLASYQKRMGLNAGSAPGTEILTAGEIAKEKGIPVSLCDREIQVTLKRAWAKSNLWNKAKLISALLSSAFSNEEFTAEELEDLKHNDSIQEMMNELAEELPGAKEALIDERDRYLATSIYSCEGHNKVAVIGAGHANGIISTIERLESQQMSKDLSDISSVPKASWLSSAAGWLVPAAIIGFVLYSCFTYSFEQGIRYFIIWALSNAAGSMVFAILSNAHPLNWIVAALGAPVAVMNPLLGVGIFTGITESRLRKPTVGDFERITDDVSTFRGWFRNRVLHAFLIFFTTSIGSILGTFVLFPVMLNILV